jgi:SSS family transporter
LQIGPGPILLAFAVLDWIVVAGYFVILAVSGWWFSRKRLSGADEYFLAGRRMPVWAVAISVIATATSAATFIGAPEEAYSGNLTYLSTNIGAFIAVALVAAFFIPAFYRHRVTTVYDLLEVRFGRQAKVAASWTFLIGRVMASGARLFIGALPLSLILFDHTQTWAVMAAIGVLVVVGILYTLVGGLRAIIWTDAIQTLVFVSAVSAAAIILFNRIPASPQEIYDALASTKVADGTKLTVLNSGLNASKPWFGFDPSQTYTLLTAIGGFSILMVAAYGTDHDLAQRMLACKSAARGSASAVTAILVNLPIVALFMVIGLLLYIYYQRPDLMGAASPRYVPEKGREVFLTFILKDMPAGLTGLMLAGLFATGLGSFNSALNAMAAAFINDAYKPRVPGKPERHYLVAGRLAVVAWGVILGLFACLCVHWQQNSEQTLIRFALQVMTFAYAGLVAVFVCAIFTRRGNQATAIAALATGFLAVLAMQPWVWKHWASAFGWESIRIAFPWQLLLATGAAFLVCIAGYQKGASRA